MTTYLLFVSARFVPIARAAGGAFSFDAHLQGFGHLIAAKPEPKSNVHLLLLADHHHHAVGWGLRRHKRVRFRMSERDMDVLESTSCRLPRLLKLIFELPALLERFDRVRALPNAAKGRDAQLVTLLEDFRQYTNRVLTWLSEWHAKIRVRGEEPYTSVPTSTMPCFVSDVDILSAEVFKTGLCFASCPNALGHVRIWVVLMVCYILQVRLEVKVATTSLASSVPSYLTKHLSKRQKSSFQDSDSIEQYAPPVRRRITTFADNACRTLIYCLGPGEGTFHGWMIVAGGK